MIAYKPLLDRAIGLATPQARRVRDPAAAAGGGRRWSPGRDHDWAETRRAARRPSDCVPVRATDPLYILYTSGTTGQPKGVVRDNGGHAVALRWSMPNVYDVQPGDVFWAASDVGWVVGHSYIVYAPLLPGCTTILYEGKPVGTPDAGAFWRVIAEHGVRTLFTAPDGVPGDQEGGPRAARTSPRYDLVAASTALFLAGERLDPDTYHWARDLLGVPVIDHWWQTETGWPIAANCIGIEPLPVKPGSPTQAGARLRRADPARDRRGGRPRRGRARSRSGCRCRRARCRRCGTTTSASSRRTSTRFPGHYVTGDGGYIDEDGYLFVMGRIDDVINVAGHRLSTGAMEEVLATHPDVAECAVIGVPDELRGQVPLGLVVLKAGVDRADDEIAARARAASCATRSARSRASATRGSSPACRRPAPARSCAARCARSPTAATTRCPRRSTIRPSSTRSQPRLS